MYFLMPHMRLRRDRFVAATCILILVLSGSISAPVFAQSVHDDNHSDDPNYSQRVISSDEGWQLIEATGVIDSTREPFIERYYMIDGPLGIATAPIPEAMKDGLIEDLASRPEGEDQTFVLSASVIEEVRLSLEQGSATPGLIEIASQPDDGELSGPLEDTGAARRPCTDADITKSKQFSASSPLSRSWNLNDGFTGTVAVTGTAQVNGLGEVKITLKKTRILFFCVPYGVRFRHARVAATAIADPGATVSGTISYSNPNPREWQIAKPFLFSVNFMAGPIPVHVGFNLPITAGFDANAINASVTGSVTYSGRRSVSGYLDYYCTPDDCTGTRNFDTTDLGSQLITAGITARFQPSVYLQVAFRGYLYSEGVAYAQAGVRPYLHADLWGYYGNNCGDADGNGHFETVDALTFDLDWQLAITAQADTFLTREWRRELWRSQRWHVGFWELTESEALSPILEGPAVVPVNSAQNYSARMRPCWPYTDNVDYILDWGDGSTEAFSGPAATQTERTHTWSQLGVKSLRLTALRDTHGRHLNHSTSRSVQANGYSGHAGMTWKLIERNGSYSHVGADAQTNPYIGDTNPAISLPILCVRIDGRAPPPGINFDFYNGWVAGELRLTAPVSGLLLTSRPVADGYCANSFGQGFRMAEFHDGGGGWTFWGQGVLSSVNRFWVAIDDQPANPWN
jgi:hypothetical protein